MPALNSGGDRCHSPRLGVLCRPSWPWEQPSPTGLRPKGSSAIPLPSPASRRTRV